MLLDERRFDDGSQFFYPPRTYPQGFVSVVLPPDGHPAAPYLLVLPWVGGSTGDVGTTFHEVPGFVSALMASLFPNACCSAPMENQRGTHQWGPSTSPRLPGEDPYLGHPLVPNVLHNTASELTDLRNKNLAP